MVQEKTLESSPAAAAARLSGQRRDGEWSILRQNLAQALAQMQGPNLPPPSPPIGAPPCGDRYPPPPPLQQQRAVVATVAPGHPGSSADAAPMAELEASGWLGGEWPLRVSLSSEEQIDIIGAAFADKLRGELRRRGGLLEVIIEARPGHGVPARAI